MRLLVFGAGEIYTRYKRYLEGHSVIAILDNNIEIHGMYIDEHKIISPQEIKLYEYDKIFIFSSYMNEISEQLLGLGIPRRKIRFVFDLIELGMKTKIKIYSTGNIQKSTRITLISHDFQIGGAQNCLLYVAKFLKEKGKAVLVASPSDGPMRSLFSKLGVDVIIDERLLISCGQHLEYLINCECLFINTAKLYYLLSYLPTDLKIIWWVHEPSTMYRGVVSWRIPTTIVKHVTSYAVSEVALRHLQRALPYLKPKTLLYGIPDKGYKNNWNRNECIIFLVIGSVCKIKGHDILLEAVSKTSVENKKKFEVWCIGRDNDDYAVNLKRKVALENLPIVFKGVLKNEETIKLMEDVDVLICSSREETMSMAVTEAMMKGVPAIIPDEIGIAKFIKDKNNGYLFKQDDASSLYQCMAYCIENVKEYRKIGKKARETYEKFFSLNSFNKRLLSVFNL